MDEIKKASLLTRKGVRLGPKGGSFIGIRSCDDYIERDMIWLDEKWLLKKCSVFRSAE